MENGKIKITITDADGDVTNFEGDNLFFVTQEDYKGNVAQGGTMGSFSPKILFSIALSTVVRIVDDITSSGKMSKIEATMLLGRLGAQFDYEAGKLIDRYSKNLTPEEIIELKNTEKDLKDATKSYFDKIETDDFDDEADKADFTS
jgi:hypothetical protein